MRALRNWADWRSALLTTRSEEDAPSDLVMRFLVEVPQR
jgi:hypothetical protein